MGQVWSDVDCAAALGICVSRNRGLVDIVISWCMGLVPNPIVVCAFYRMCEMCAIYAIALPDVDRPVFSAPGHVGCSLCHSGDYTHRAHSTS